MFHHFWEIWKTHLRPTESFCLRWMGWMIPSENSSIVCWGGVELQLKLSFSLKILGMSYFCFRRFVIKMLLLIYTLVQPLERSRWKAFGRGLVLAYFSLTFGEEGVKKWLKENCLMNQWPTFSAKLKTTCHICCCHLTCITAFHFIALPLVSSFILPVSSPAVCFWVSDAEPREHRKSWPTSQCSKGRCGRRGSNNSPASNILKEMLHLMLVPTKITRKNWKKPQNPGKKRWFYQKEI